MTFRRRLESGRAALARRLTRRGVTLSAALSAPLLADAAAQASVSPLLVANTVPRGLASASGQVTDAMVSAQVRDLVEAGTSTLLAKKANVVLVVLVSLMLGLGGLLAHRAFHSPTLAEAPAAPPAAPSPPVQSKSKGQTIDIKGRVLDPDGKPLAGARLLLMTDAPRKRPTRRFGPRRTRTDNFVSRSKRRTSILRARPRWPPRRKGTVPTGSK